MERERSYSVPSGSNSRQKHFSPLSLVEVSHSNKLELLDKSISASNEGLDETQDMLARLQRYQPSMAEEFHVKGIAISKAPLRLLCEVQKDPQLDWPPRISSYIALSYCWHGPDWEVAHCLGPSEMGWPIATAMLHSLLEQREFPGEGVWFDQYCINQQDPLDKQLAVGSMDLFYKSARKVVVILEDVNLSEEEETLFEKVRLNWEPKNEDLETLASILIRILSARWFQRTWCSHELQLSNELIFILATKTDTLEMSPNDLERLYSVTSDYILQDGRLTALMTQDIYRSYDFFTRTIERKSEKPRGRSLSSEFADIHGLSCSSQTDVLCIAMNISGLQIYFTGQIRSQNECRWVLAMVALSAGDATVLGGVDKALFVEDRIGTPSWLNWTNDLESTMTRVGYSKLPETTFISSIDQNQITLDVLGVDGTTLSLPSQSHYMRADLLVSLLYIVYANKSLDDKAYWMKPNADPIEISRDRRFVVEMLACSLDCGLEWMTKQMVFAPKLARQVQDLMGDFGSLFWPMLVEFAVTRNSPESTFLNQLDEERKTALMTYVYFILFDPVCDLGSLPSFLPSKAAASSRVPQPEPVQRDDEALIRCLWLGLGLGNKALVAMPPGIPGIIERGRLVMPVALSDGSCAGVRRLWHISSSSGDGNGVSRLVGKYHMFTLMPINENDFVIRSRRQIVAH